MIHFLRKLTVRHWAVLALFNLLLVAALGMLMRLKVLFPLPALNQKYLLHAHSHFAFSGWVSHALMLLMAAAVCGAKSRENLPWKYQAIIIANLLASYGMLVSFSLQGYGLYSIFASSLTVIVSYIFAVIYWRDTGLLALGIHVRNWFRASLVFLVFSSIGTFFLAYLMATHHIDTRLQLAAVYFFLHFQYNGWFFFACMGLAQHWLLRKGIVVKHAKAVYWLFALTCIPTYLLSVLWWNMPDWTYIIVVMAVIAQGTGWLIWLRSVITQLPQLRQHIPAMPKWLLIGVIIATTIKLILQGLSVIPSLSQLTYSFRPIVIGYLHLVLLVIISLFIIAYTYLNGHLRINQRAVLSTGALVTGVVLNELLLMLQGISGLGGVYIGHIPLALGVAAVIIVVGLIGLLWSQYISTSPISS